MIPANFEYIRATSVEQAVNLLQQHGYDAKLLAGGHSLLPAMKLRLNRPEILIDIGNIPNLNNISEQGDNIVVGANCTHAQIEKSTLIKEKLNILAQTASVIGDVQIRNHGTIGGSLAHSDPSSKKDPHGEVRELFHDAVVLDDRVGVDHHTVGDASVGLDHRARVDDDPTSNGRRTRDCGPRVDRIPRSESEGAHRGK